MADMTDADKKSFTDKLIGALEKNKAALIEKGWDPTQRIAALTNGATSVTNDEGVISSIEVALASASATRRTDLDNNYALASASVASVEGALGKDHPLVKDLRQIRGGMSRTKSAKKTAASAK